MATLLGIHPAVALAKLEMNQLCIFIKKSLVDSRLLQDIVLNVFLFVTFLEHLLKTFMNTSKNLLQMRSPSN
jgi:hypothetical protein